MSNKTISIAQENKLFDGIDVSSYQGTIDFNRVKASGIDVVYAFNDRHTQSVPVDDKKGSQHYADGSQYCDVCLCGIVVG